MKLIDLHCDTIYHLYQDQSIALKKNQLQVDLNKLEEANTIAQFFAVFIDLEELERKSDAFSHALKMIERFKVLIKQNKSKIELASSYDSFIAKQKQNKISAFLTIEEGHVVLNKISNLEELYRAGVRLITLTWNYPNCLGYPNHNYQYSNQGLTNFGKEVIKAMNHLGILIDVSHLSDQGFFDVAELSKQPFIASHSNARSVTNHPRNLTDKMIKTIAKRGGVIGINFSADFLGESSISQVRDMTKHIQHIKKVGGIDCLALGTDFDGISCQLEINNISEINKLYHHLKNSGFSNIELEKIFYKNITRVIKDVLS